MGMIIQVTAHTNLGTPSPVCELYIDYEKGLQLFFSSCVIHAHARFIYLIQTSYLLIMLSVFSSLQHELGPKLVFRKLLLGYI